MRENKGTYNALAFIPQDASKKYRDNIIMAAKENAIMALSEEITDGEWYVFRITSEERVSIERMGKEILYHYDITKCEKETAKIPMTLEKQLFTPNKKFFARLWTGIRYLFLR